MAQGINKFIGIGNVTKDPDVRYIGDGTAVANFSIAVNETWKDKNTGEKKESAEFIRIVAWRRLGEICGEYLNKGSSVYVEGKLQTRSWEQDGVTRYVTEIIASTVQFLGGRSQSTSSGQGYPEPPTADAQDDDIPF